MGIDDPKIVSWRRLNALPAGEYRTAHFKCRWDGDCVRDAGHFSSMEPSGPRLKPWRPLEFTSESPNIAMSEIGKALRRISENRIIGRDAGQLVSL